MTESVITQLPVELEGLSRIVEENVECLAIGSVDLQAAALRAVKFVFDLALQTEAGSKSHVDAFVSSVTSDEPPQTRSRARANGKRKRSPSPAEPAKRTQAFSLTPLPSLFIESMHEDQIWHQLDLRSKSICDLLDETLEGSVDEPAGADATGDDDTVIGAEGSEDDFFLEEESDDSADDEEGGETEEDELDQSEGLYDEEEGEEEDFTGFQDSSFDEDDGNGLSPSPSSLVGRPTSGNDAFSGSSELNDGFFDLNEFNAETEEAEANSISKGRLDMDDDEDSELDDQSIDLFQPVDNVENFDEDDLEGNGGELFYRAFFDPLPHISSSRTRNKSSGGVSASSRVRFNEQINVRNIKAKGKGLSVSVINDEEDIEDGEGKNDDEFGVDQTIFDDIASSEEDEENVGREDGLFGDRIRDTVQRLKDDIFAEEEEPVTELSTHERRMAALKAQIKQLEDENVAKKDWVLTGEASSKARPLNSLLEEDLEFERAMKAVPAVTEESVHSLEERIKARVLEGSFDDVVRKRPLDEKPFLPSRVLELQDTKSTQSLAQIYEAEYTAAQTGSLAGEDRDGKLQKEHLEIEKLWEEICSKLDALCNAHYVPKQPKAIISTVSNVAAASLESALPTTKSASTMLAPEEVFAPSSSNSRAKSELTPAQKKSLRLKERKSRKKTRDVLDKAVDKYSKTRSISAAKKQKEQALKSVVKHGKGVTVVGKVNKRTTPLKHRTKS